MYKMHNKKLITITLISLLQMSSFADVVNTPLRWQLSQLTENKQFDIRLVCNEPPSVGEFQTCNLEVFDHLSKNTTNLEDKAKADTKAVAKDHHDKPNKSSTKLNILMDGGMPAHQHGLPTSPVVNYSDSDNSYIIEGLKFSMPGEWLLNFYLEGNGVKIKDRISYRFTID